MGRPVGSDSPAGDGISVLVADDHPLYLDSIVKTIGNMPDATVVGRAGDGADAIALAVETRPDVVLMDVNMPGTNGIEATRRIISELPETAVLVLTMFEEVETIRAALRAGARGYLLKDCDGEQVLSAIRSVAVGEAVFGPGVMPHIFESFTTPRAARTAFPQLTDREFEILEHIAAGDPNPIIASKLHITSKTVRNHISNIFMKLGVTTRAEAIVLARRHGLGRRD